MERMAVWEENYAGSVPERMRDNGGRTNPLRESLKSHLEDGCGATVPSETELRELPTKKKGKLSFLRLYFHVVCLHGCNHTAKPLNSDQPETQNERLMVLEIEECVPSPNHKSGFKI